MKVNANVVVYVDWLGGSRSFEFPRSVCADDASCKAAVLAELGVSEHEFDDWLAEAGRVRCIASTAAGSQCKHHVSGPVHEDPKEWVEASRIGGYCRIHGGE